MKQTAVEWLVNRWKKLQAKGEKMTWQQVIDITELAKEVEKEQSERMYSEEEMLQALNIGFTSTDETWEECVEFAKEQFKKK